ncbi:MFS transporter [Legionella jordanis]|nr:MFS transporter [Legionella jordanis]RMX04014.1 MFS transporter [Legionella jordanis]RMX22131.1 MFS transporter [Legionella jordanis]HAT8712817.1 MFS transporter [Legionella jordanis]
MASISVPMITTVRRYGIWLISVSFVLFQFFLQLSSGVIIGAIMQEQHFSALAAGILSSSFYYVYTSMQIPVGMLFDRKNTRYLLAMNALICSLGCFYFAHSNNLFSLMIGRMMIGAGSAFAFVGLSHLLRQHFPLKHFGFMIGLSETLGFLATMLGMLSMGSFIAHWGWRSIMNAAVVLGLLIALLSWQFIPSSKNSRLGFNYRQQLLPILLNRQAWINGIFVGLSFTVITVFGAMWAVPFIQIKLGCSLKMASIIDSMIFLGAAVSCPLFGYLANLFPKRKPLMLASCLGTALLIVAMLYLPFTHPLLLALFMFMIGAACGAYMLAFSIANELAPAEALSTCTGFTNTLAMLSAPLMQPLVGLILDYLETDTTSLIAYQVALLVIPGCLLIAAALVFLLPEK